jgi:hypothetical protein
VKWHDIDGGIQETRRGIPREGGHPRPCRGRRDTLFPSSRRAPPERGAPVPSKEARGAQRSMSRGGQDVS